MSQFPEEQLSMPSSEGFGYFPSYPGQRLNKGRYEIVRKLGYGPRSSVWIALNSLNNEYFVIKVLTVHETLQKPQYELDALTIAERQGYINLYESFSETSHHGMHLCLVLDVAGPSLEDFRLSSPTKSLSRHIVQRAIACVLEELKKLHKCGLIHGALVASNIVFEIDGSRDDLDLEFAKLLPCTIEQNIAIEGVEYPIVRSHPVPYGNVGWDASWAVINRSVINLINLGHAQKIKGAPTWEKSRMDKSLRPPEVILGLPYSSKVDVWMLGCTVYHMLTGKPLVPEEKLADDGLMLGWLIAMSGDSITPDMALKYKLKAEYFDESGILKLKIPEETLESQISLLGIVPADDIPGIVKFIQKCLTLDFEKRLSPEQLFWDEWVEPGLEG